MNRITAILFSIITSIIVLSVICYNEVSAADFINYEYDFPAFEASVTEWLDDYNPHSLIPVEGEIRMLKAFYLTEFSDVDDKYYKNKSDVTVFVPLVCDDKVIALISTYSYNRCRMPSSIYPVSEFAGKDYKNGLSFFRVCGSISNYDLYGGSYEFDIFTVNDESTARLAYFEVNSRSADSNQRILAENTRAAFKYIPEYRLISKMNHIDKNTESIYSFNYKYNGKNAVSDNRSCYIHNKDGKYLSYSDGKFYMTEKRRTVFVISDNKNGTFSISPENSDRKMSVKGTDSFLIGLSYFDGYYYSVSSADEPSSVMKASGDNVSFTVNNNTKVWNTANDWYIEKFYKSAEV